MKHISKRRTKWNHTALVVFTPLFDWPPKPKGAILALTKRWGTLSRNVLFLGMAFMVFGYLIPEDTAMQSLSLGWVSSLFLRNYLFMLVIAGGLLPT